MRTGLALLIGRWGVGLLAAATAGLSCGCGAGGDKKGPEGGTAEALEQSEVALPNPVFLTPDHPGWKEPLCLGCHGQTAPYPHADAGYAPPVCVSCHGGNGAPHTDHATKENPGCTECHGDITHVPAFQGPDDCVACHYQPTQP